MSARFSTVVAILIPKRPGASTTSQTWLTTPPPGENLHHRLDELVRALDQLLAHVDDAVGHRHGREGDLLRDCRRELLQVGPHRLGGAVA